MRIDIVAVKSSLYAENDQLNQSRNAFAALRRATDIDEKVLSGYAFGRMRSYCANSLDGLSGSVQHAINEKIRANKRYERLLDKYFPGMSYVCLEDIERQRQEVSDVRCQLSNVLDNPFVKVATLGISGLVDDLLQGPLKTYERELQKKINDFQCFLHESGSCYASARFASGVASGKLQEAESIWSEAGGYSLPALIRVSGSENVAFVPEYTGSVTAESYIAANGATGSVCTYNYDGGVSCTYYTLRKLRERGVTFPFAYAGGANGGQWIDNCSDGVPRYRGSDAIDQMIADYWDSPPKPGDSLTNVVITFSGPSPTGHVLLIDKLYVDKDGTIRVSFSDIYNYETRDKLFDSNGTNTAQDLAKTDFYAMYGQENSGVSGAILIGGCPEKICD